jgi:hypothetical protein
MHCKVFALYNAWYSLKNKKPSISKFINHGRYIKIY